MVQIYTDAESAFVVSEIVPNFESIPEGEIENMEGFDMEAYDEMELNSPWYKNPSGAYEGWYCEIELKPEGFKEKITI